MERATKVGEKYTLPVKESHFQGNRLKSSRQSDVKMQLIIRNIPLKSQVAILRAGTAS